MATQTVLLTADLQANNAYWSDNAGGTSNFYAHMNDGSDSTYAVNDQTAGVPGTAVDGVFRFATPTGDALGIVESLTYRVRHILVGTPTVGSYTTTLPGYEVETQFGSRTITPRTSGLRWDELTVVPPVGTLGGDIYNTIRLAPPDAGRYTYPVGDGPRFTQVECVFTYFTAPEVTVSAPTGTLTTTMTPLIEWTVATGKTLDFQRVRIFNDATYGAGGFNPGTSSGALVDVVVSGSARAYQVTEPLPNDTYRVYVQAVQTSNGTVQESDWTDTNARSEFTVNITAPVAPVWDDDFSSDDEGYLSPQWVEGGGSSSTPTDEFDVERLDDGEWVRILTGVPDQVLETYQLIDYRPGNGVSKTYRVRSAGYVSGERFVSAWVTSTPPVSWSSDDVWIKVATPGTAASTANVKILPASEAITGVSVDRSVGRFGVLGSATPVVTYDVLRRSGGQLTLTCITWGAGDGPGGDFERDDFDEMLADAGPHHLQFPASWGEPDRWVVVASHERRRVPGALAHETSRLEVLTLIETSEPAFPSASDSVIS